MDCNTLIRDNITFTTTDMHSTINIITNIQHSVPTGDVNAYSTLWYSYTDDHIGHIITDIISNSDLITLNTNTPTKVPKTTLQQTPSPNIPDKLVWGYDNNNNIYLKSDIHKMFNRLYIKTYTNNITEIHV